jgi:hypothetical protein
LVSQLGDHLLVAVSIQEIKSERGPLPGRNKADEVEQENEQIVGVARGRGDGFNVRDFEIDQPRAIVLRIVHDIGNRSVSMRPTAAEFIAEKSMRAPEFFSRGFEHSPVQRSRQHVIPQTGSRQFLDADRVLAAGVNVKFFSVQHFETVDFPAAPILYVAPKPNRNSGDAKVKICKLGQLFAVGIPALHDYPATTSRFFRDRIDLQCLNNARTRVGQRARDQTIDQRRPII